MGEIIASKWRRTGDNHFGKIGVKNGKSMFLELVQIIVDHRFTIELISISEIYTQIGSFHGKIIIHIYL